MNTLRISRRRQHILKSSIKESGDTIPNKTIRFEILQGLSKKHDLKLLCKLSNVSLSGYYKQKKSILFIQERKAREEKDTELIREISVESKQKYGYRTVVMKLAQKEVHMNHKKVLRLMKKYGLLARVRRKNPYKQIMRKTQEHKVVRNVLNREFYGATPLRKI